MKPPPGTPCLTPCLGPPASPPGTHEAHPLLTPPGLQRSLLDCCPCRSPPAPKITSSLVHLPQPCRAPLVHPLGTPPRDPPAPKIMSLPVVQAACSTSELSVLGQLPFLPVLHSGTRGRLGQEMQRLPMCMGSGIAPPPLRMVPSPPAAPPTSFLTCPRRRKCWAHLALIFS